MIGFRHIIHAIDMHCAGEPARVVLSGVPEPRGATMGEKKADLAGRLDHFRELLMREPRGHAGMYGVLVTPPVSDGAGAGLLFMDNGGYLDMCGHGTLCAARALMETGQLRPTPARPVIRFDTPAGLLECRVPGEGAGPGAVSLENAPAFVAARGVPLDIAGLGRVEADVAFGGNFFALVPARRFGLDLGPGNAAELSRLGLEIREAINAVLPLSHPEIPGIDRVALTMFYEEADTAAMAVRTVAAFGAGQIDRCPCGTGTSALMALMHARGRLPIGAGLEAQSIIGTTFTGTLIGECRVGDFAAVRPEIAGAAHMTGIHQFVVDPDDPLPRGFLLG
ncbi:MAG: proline racemase family protein [Paracoccaceae bacterium]